MDSGTLAYETTLVARTEGFPSSLERGRTRRRETRNGAQKLKQDEPPFPRATGPLLLHDIPTNYATNPRPTSSIRSTVHLCTKSAADSGPTSVRRHQFQLWSRVSDKFIHFCGWITRRVPKVYSNSEEIRGMRDEWNSELSFSAQLWGTVEKMQIWNMYNISINKSFVAFKT